MGGPDAARSAAEALAVPKADFMPPSARPIAAARPNAPHIPAFLPRFPDRHAYSHTPVSRLCDVCERVVCFI